MRNAIIRVIHVGSKTASRSTAVVIVGRPNVGKSTLFNRITGQRRSIVGDEPGITRDRIHGVAATTASRFELIDTGGIVVSDADYIPSQILAQARVALEQASQVIFLVDGRTELTASDRELAADAAQARQAGHAGRQQDAIPAARKTWSTISTRSASRTSSRFRPSTASASTRCSITSRVTFPSKEKNQSRQAGIKVAIIGRPNVGKSTLLNALTGQERAIVSPIAGTTRDAVDETVDATAPDYVFVDTAGIRRKGKTKEMAEKLSVVMARRNIRLADIVLVVMDASEGFVALDATIAGYAHEGGRPVILCINKWDLITSGKRKEFEQNVRDRLKFLDYAPMVFMSALKAHGVNELLELIKRVNESAFQRVTTGELNRFVETLHFEERKVLYITQASVRPPSFVLFTDKAGPLHFSHERYLTNQLRKRFGFEGTPIHLKVRGRTVRRERTLR